MEQLTTEKRRAIEELIKKYDQWTEKTPQMGITREAAFRQARILSIIRKLGHAKASQIARELYPTRKNPPITFYRDLKALTEARRIEKQWTREEGEFYVVTKQSNHPLCDLMDGLVFASSVLVDNAYALREAWLEAVTNNKPPDFNAWLTHPYEIIEAWPMYIVDTMKDIKARLSNLQFPLTTAEPAKCSECGSTVFNKPDKDGPEVCAKCGLEKDLKTHTAIR